MLTVRRFDRGELSKPTKLANGWLRVDGYITRAGIFSYRSPDGKVRKELRAASQVLTTDSLGTFSLVPLTMGHPPTGLLDVTNTKSYQVGTVERPEADGTRARASILVTDSSAIEALESGALAELSCGYLCDLDETPGVFEGERYDAVQTNVRGNHVALVGKGRAGPDVKVRMDSTDAVEVVSPQVTADLESAPEESANMVKIKVDGIEVEVSEIAAQALAKQATALETSAAAAKLATEKLQARADGLDAELTKVKAELVAAPDKVRAEISARVALETKAKTVLGETKLDGLKDSEIKTAVVAELRPSVKLDGKSADYLEASFELALEAHAAGKSAFERTDAKDEKRFDTGAPQGIDAAVAEFHKALKGAKV